MKNSYKPYQLFFFLSILILIAIFALSIYQFDKLRHSRYWVIHSYEVMIQTKEINRLLLDVNLKIHKYLLHNNKNELSNYESTLKALKENVRLLILITQDNRQQNELSQKLTALVDQKINLMNLLIKDHDLAPALTEQKKELLKQINSVHTELNHNTEIIEQVEKSLLQERSQTLQFHTYIVNFILIAGELIALICILAAFYILNQELQKRLQAEKRSKNIESQIRSILEGSYDLIAALDLNHRYIFFNRAYEEEFFPLFNKTVSIGTDLFEILKNVPEGDRIVQSWKRSLQGIHKKEIIEINLQGKTNTYELTSSPVHDMHDQMVGAVHIVRNITERAGEELSLKEAYNKIHLGMMELEEKNTKITALVEMSDTLLACSSIPELCQVTAKYAKKILSFTRGILYIMHPSKDRVVQNASWGDMKDQEILFTPDKCWALRLGHLNYSSASTELYCDHLKLNKKDSLFICVPLRAQNEIYGLLVLETIKTPSAELLNDTENLLLNAFSESIALSLSNLSLRDNLQQQSLHDPLTTLYNRRFLDEFLHKQFALAMDQKIQIAILMLDIDHFKKINDTFGHEAGDHVLKEIGTLIAKSIRAGDLAARYGGEEFLIGFFNVRDLEVIRMRAMRILEDMKEITLPTSHQTHWVITASIGIAIFPTDGKTVNEVIEAADKALYQAKERGRNRVLFSHELNNQR